jgi:superoxide dismutase, Cu-Zn family
MRKHLLAALALGAFAGCSRTALEQHEGTVDLMDAGAEAEMRLADGAPIGTLRLTQVEGGVRITGSLTGITPGQHGLHIHEVGRCDAPSFESAKAHFNPLGMEHGLENPKGPHAGDSPNITADAQSGAPVNILLTHASLRRGRNNIIDGNGAAIIVHAKPDDQQTDPSGNSGGRIACGVIVRRGS